MNMNIFSVRAALDDHIPAIAAIHPAQSRTHQPDI
jgi:hypothetical protein